MTTWQTMSDGPEFEDDDNLPDFEYDEEPEPDFTGNWLRELFEGNSYWDYTEDSVPFHIEEEADDDE